LKSGRPSASQASADPVFWAAWLYYECGLKQDEVAAKLDCSRASVFNLLQRARDENIVTVAIDTTRMQRNELALELMERCNLDECHLMASHNINTPLYDQLGQFGARIVEQRINDNEILGVSWGRTVLALSQSLTRLDKPGVSVAQINGSAMATYDFSPELCTSNIASRLNARCVNLLAPGVVSSSRIKDLLMKEPIIKQHFKLLRDCQRTLFGVTHLGKHTLLSGTGFMQAKQLADYKKHNAVGYASGYFFDIEGNVIKRPFDDRYIVMPLRDFMKVEQRICIGGGNNKVEAIVGMLKARMVSVLITDENTAQGVCNWLRK